MLEAEYYFDNAKHIYRSPVEDYNIVLIEPKGRDKVNCSYIFCIQHYCSRYKFRKVLVQLGKSNEPYIMVDGIQFDLTEKDRIK